MTISIPGWDEIWGDPNLAIGKQPTSDVVLNDGVSPRPLDFLYLLRRNVLDLTGKTKLASEGVAPPYDVDVDGHHGLFDSSGIWNDDSAYNKAVTDYTVFAIGTYHSGGKYCTVQEINTGSNKPEQITLGSSGSSVRIGYRGRNGSTYWSRLSDTAFSDGDLVVMVGLRRGDELRLFVSGKDEGTTSGIHVDSWRAEAIVLGGSHKGSGGWNYDLNGNIYTAGGFEGAWSDAQALAFTRDPYRYLFSTRNISPAPGVAPAAGGSLTASAAWRILNQHEQDSAYKIKAKSAVDSAYKVFGQTAQSSAWRLFSSIGEDSGWKIKGQLSHNSAWKTFNQTAQGSAWSIFNQQDSDCAWKVFGLAQVDTDWRILNSSLMQDTAWRILASNQASQPIAWKIINTLQQASAYRLLTQAVQDSGWAVLNQLSQDSGWALLNTTQQQALWKILATEQAGSAYKILNSASVDSSWRVLAQQLQASGWRIFTTAEIDSAWMVDGVLVVPITSIEFTASQRDIIISATERTIIFTG